MKFHCLAFVLIIVSIASGQLTECNPANNTTVNSTEALIQTPEPVIDTSIQYSEVIDLDFEVIEIGSESARFGIGKKEPAKHEMYKISIMNKGDIRITGVIVSAEMERDMKFESTRYYEDNRGRLDAIVDPPYFKKGTKTNLTWDIATLEPEETKSILLEAYIKPGVNKTNVSVDVTGEYGGSYIKSRRDNAIVAKYDYVNRNTSDICDDSSDTEDCEKRCPPWSIPQ